MFELVLVLWGCFDFVGDEVNDKVEFSWGVYSEIFMDFFGECT